MPPQESFRLYLKNPAVASTARAAINLKLVSEESLSAYVERLISDDLRRRAKKFQGQGLTVPETITKP